MPTKAADNHLAMQGAMVLGYLSQNEKSLRVK